MKRTTIKKILITAVILAVSIGSVEGLIKLNKKEEVKKVEVADIYEGWDEVFIPAVAKVGKDYSKKQPTYVPKPEPQIQEPDDIFVSVVDKIGK